MDELNREESREAYIPRPRWQVWGARAALVFMLIAVALYYWNMFHPPV